MKNAGFSLYHMGENGEMLVLREDGIAATVGEMHNEKTYDEIFAMLIAEVRPAIDCHDQQCKEKEAEDTPVTA